MEKKYSERVLAVRGSAELEPSYSHPDGEHQDELAKELARLAAGSLRADGTLEKKDTTYKTYVIATPGFSITKWRLTASTAYAGNGTQTTGTEASGNITFGEAADLDNLAIGDGVRVTYEKVGNGNVLKNIRAKPL